MRLVAICLAGLLLMQLPAMASIVPPTSVELDAAPAWQLGYGLTWDTAHGLFRLPSHETGATSEGPLMLPTDAFAALTANGFDLSYRWDAELPGGQQSFDIALLGNLGCPVGLGLETQDWSKINEQEEYFHNIRIAASSLCPEPATLTIWGVSALALAAATYRRQKRGGRNGKHVQAAVKEYLEACDTPSQHFRLLGSYLTRLADDPNWTKQDVEAFYDEVVVALHRRREHAEVA